MLPVFTATVALWAGAIPSAMDLKEHERAAQELEAMVARGAERAEMPRLTDASVARVLSTLSDERRFLASPFPPDPIDLPMGICKRSGRAMVAYLMSGIGSLAGVEPEVAARRLQVQMAKNVLAYQDELALLMPFGIRCGGRLTEAMSAWVQSRSVAGFADVQRQGLARSRQGILATYVGALVSALDPALKESFREGLLRAAADAAPALSAALAPDGRRSVLEALRSARMSGPLKSQAIRIEKEMSRTDCQGLCAL